MPRRRLVPPLTVLLLMGTAVIFPAELTPAAADDDGYGAAPPAVIADEDYGFDVPLPAVDGDTDPADEGDAPPRAAAGITGEAPRALVDDAQQPHQEPDTEIIRERYPDTRVKIERQVTQDEQGNYINHGSWKFWDQNGGMLAQGTFQYGERHGSWIRVHSRESSPLFSQPPYSHFSPPFYSQATFKNGQLHGSWTIYDARKRPVSELVFKDGQRHGVSTWWYPAGKKMKEVVFRDGILDGDLRQWDERAQLTVERDFKEGRRTGAHTTQHSNGQKKSEAVYLFARVVAKSPDDWWNARMALYETQGKDEKHGPWRAWHENGQLKMEGRFEHDIPVGRFVAWYANGQKQWEGEYAQGTADGRFTWWHTNGQKKLEGEYVHGNPNGRWTWWKEDGRVTHAADFSSQGEEITGLPVSPEPSGRTSLRSQDDAEQQSGPSLLQLH